MTDSTDNDSAAWRESLTRSKSQIEAGQAVPMAPFLERLRASIARMEMRRADKAVRQARKA